MLENNILNVLLTIKRIFPKLQSITLAMKAPLKVEITIGETSEKLHPISFDMENYSVVCYFGEKITEKDKLVVKNVAMYLLKFIKAVFQSMRVEAESIKVRRAVELAGALASNLRIDRLLKQIQEGICELLEAEAASILIYNEKKNILEFMVTTGEVSGRIEKIPVPMNSIAGTIFLNEKTMIFNDLEKDNRHFKGVDKASGFVTRNIVGSPIWLDGKKIGVIEVLNKEGGFDAEDAEVLETFAKLIGYKLSTLQGYEEMSRRLKSVILAIATAIDKRDRYTHMHSKNVTDYSLRIGRLLGLSQKELEELEISALLHDVGKIGIEDAILLKRGKLTDEEFAKIKSHTIIGAEITKKVRFINRDIVSGILEHHEKLDGSGYPYGKKNGEIGLFGRIVAVADIFDALTTARPYKDPWPVDKVLRILKEDAGVKLDKKCVEALEKVITAK